MDKFQVIKDNVLIDILSNSGKMLNTSLDDLAWLIEKVEELQKQVDYWKDNYHIKESLSFELNKHNESLIIENMSLKSTKHLRSLKNGGGFQELNEDNPIFKNLVDNWKRD